NLSADAESVPQKPDFESLLSQVDKLESELESERKKNAEQINPMKYLQADLINMQKQADRMVSETKLQVKLNWILEVISIKEDLNRALQSASSENSILIDGLKLLTSRIENDLKAEDIRPINVELGAEFDPRIHEAVASQETDVAPEGSILSVVANGYTIGGKVIKPALIEVARRKTPPTTKENPMDAPKKIPSDSPKGTPVEDNPEELL
ncbi:MAG: nucleotide exchange factor GrpE, partial [Nitrososphaerales archaeon]